MVNKKGFTLIELSISIAVMCIILYSSSSLVLDLSSKKQEVLLDTASIELLSDMRLIQQKAMEEGCIYNILFNSTENSYMIYNYRNAQSIVYKNKKLPDCISFDSVRSTYSSNKISFNSKGKPLPYPCTVSLINKRGEYRRIVISIGTDYIGIKDT